MRGTTPTLRRIMAATKSPMLGFCSKAMRTGPPARRTVFQVGQVRFQETPSLIYYREKAYSD
jgi:hypothetical protein